MSVHDWFECNETVVNQHIKWNTSITAELTFKGKNVLANTGGVCDQQPHCDYKPIPAAGMDMDREFDPLDDKNKNDHDIDIKRFLVQNSVPENPSTIQDERINRASV